jgi:hypothetical protein
MKKVIEAGRPSGRSGSVSGQPLTKPIMSTYYKPYPGLGPKFELMQFAGGENRGLCLQITPRNERGGLGPIQLTKSDAINLRAALLDWLDGKLSEDNL